MPLWDKTLLFPVPYTTYSGLQLFQAGGAPTNSSLSAAIASIQESLKSRDWITRKAASAALGEIASSGGAFFGSFRSSSLRSLESCRFDKVCNFLLFTNTWIRRLQVLKFYIIEPFNVSCLLFRLNQLGTLHYKHYKSGETFQGQIRQSLQKLALQLKVWPFFFFLLSVWMDWYGSACIMDNPNLLYSLICLSLLITIYSWIGYPMSCICCVSKWVNPCANLFYFSFLLFLSSVYLCNVLFSL